MLKGGPLSGEISGQRDLWVQPGTLKDRAHNHGHGIDDRIGHPYGKENFLESSRCGTGCGVTEDAGDLGHGNAEQFIRTLRKVLRVCEWNS